MIIRKIFTTLILFTPLFCFGINIPRQSLDSLLQGIEQEDKAMGTVSIYAGGEEVYNNSFGYENIEKSIRASKATKYRIVSMSKMFTATVIMKLIEEGRLSLDTKLSKFYPDMKNADKITIRQMLSHRSGIQNYDRDQWLPITRKENPKKEIYELISRNFGVFEPDAGYSYSNTNFVLLGWIAADVTGKSFESLLRKIVIDPAGLKNTYPGRELNPVKNEAVCYLRYDNRWKSRIVEHHEFMLPDGGLVSTPSDILKFMDALFSGKLISMESVNAMKLCEKDNYGYGIQRYSYRGQEQPLYGHSGVLYGYRSIALDFPEYNFSVAVMLNAFELTPEEIVGVIMKMVVAEIEPVKQ